MDNTNRKLLGRLNQDLPREVLVFLTIFTMSLTRVPSVLVSHAEGSENEKLLELLEIVGLVSTLFLFLLFFSYIRSSSLTTFLQQTLL